MLVTRYLVALDCVAVCWPLAPQSEAGQRFAGLARRIREIARLFGRAEPNETRRATSETNNAKQTKKDTSVNR